MLKPTPNFVYLRRQAKKRSLSASSTRSQEWVLKVRKPILRRPTTSSAWEVGAPALFPRLASSLVPRARRGCRATTSLLARRRTPKKPRAETDWPKAGEARWIKTRGTVAAGAAAGAPLANSSALEGRGPSLAFPPGLGSMLNIRKSRTPIEGSRCFSPWPGLAHVRGGSGPQASQP